MDLAGPTRRAAEALRPSPRQREILGLIAAGKSDIEIAGILGISSRTVGSHLQRLYLAHGLHTRAAAVAAMMRDQAEARSSP